MDSIIPLGQKTTLAEYMILSGADNRLLMLDKDLYDSWNSIMELYMQNKENRRMILESVENGPLIWLTIEENGLISIHFFNHHRVANDLWKRVQLLMQDDTILLYAYQYPYTNPQFLQQFSPSQSPYYGLIPPPQHYSTTYPSTSLAISYPSTSYPNDYSSTIHQEAFPQPPYVPQIEYTVSTVNQETHMAEFPQIDSGLAVLVFKKGDDSIDSINKMISFLSSVVTSREGHMARQYPKLKRKRDATWFRDKVLLVKAQRNDKVLNEEELEFLAGPAKAVLMANLSSYGLDALSEDINSSAEQDVMILSVFKQLSNQVTNCNKVNKDNLIANKTLSDKLERYKERVKFPEERQNVDLGKTGCHNIIKSDLRKLKGKEIANNVAQVSNATTIAPGMYKLDPVILAIRGVNHSTSASGSKPSSNTKNDKISRTPSSHEKNKVEVQYRKVKSSLNKRNYDFKNVCIEQVMHPVKGAKAL
nr:hypothetical protein [Tanacetum cinerariifolium]GEX48538.1 hypothetical protein [Tanacetum cinerariifolium]